MGISVELVELLCLKDMIEVWCSFVEFIVVVEIIVCYIGKLVVMFCEVLEICGFGVCCFDLLCYCVDNCVEIVCIGLVWLVCDF